MTTGLLGALHGLGEGGKSGVIVGLFFGLKERSGGGIERICHHWRGMGRVEGAGGYIIVAMAMLLSIAERGSRIEVHILH